MTINPKRGEIWLIDLDTTIGAEIKKTRLAYLSKTYLRKWINQTIPNKPTII